MRPKIDQPKLLILSRSSDEIRKEILVVTMQEPLMQVIMRKIEVTSSHTLEKERNEESRYRISGELRTGLGGE